MDENEDETESASSVKKCSGCVENLTAAAILFRVGTIGLNQTNRITKKVTP